MSEPTQQAPPSQPSQPGFDDLEPGKFYEFMLTTGYSFRAKFEEHEGDGCLCIQRGEQKGFVNPNQLAAVFESYA